LRFKPYRTLIVLLAAQSFGQTAAPIMVLLEGIIGTQIAPSRDLATLPLGFMIIGMAAATIPASMMMARLGRRKRFLSGSALSVFGALLAPRQSDSID